MLLTLVLNISVYSQEENTHWKWLWFLTITDLSQDEKFKRKHPLFTNIIHSLMHLNPHSLPFSSNPKDKDIKILSLSFLHESREYQNSPD